MPKPRVNVSAGRGIVSFSWCGCRFRGQTSHIGDFTAPQIEWVCKTVLEGSFLNHISQFVHVNGMVEHVAQVTRWRLGEITSVLDLVLKRTPKDIGSIELKSRQAGVITLHFA